MIKTFNIKLTFINTIASRKTFDLKTYYSLQEAQFKTNRMDRTKTKGKNFKKV